MANRQVDSVTVVSDGYAYGTKIVGPPDRHDPTPDEREAARRADRITYTELLRERGWTEAQFEEAKCFNLIPTALGHNFGPWHSPTKTPYYSRRQLAELDARVRALLK